MTPPANSAFRDLVRVVSSGETHVQNGIAVSLLAVELYTDGSIVTTRVWSDVPVPWNERLEPSPQPEVQVVVTDNLGTQYPGHRAHATELSLAKTYWEGRWTFKSNRPIAQHAAHLVVTIPAFEWMRVDRQSLLLVPYRIQTGPWEFTVPLSK